MKSNHLFPLLLIILIYISTSCKKEVVWLEELRKMNPIADAGPDLYFWSPQSESELTGSSVFGEENLQSVSWLKITGPDTYRIAHKDSLRTTISGLVSGVYQFELTLIDKANRVDKDTMAVFVGDPVNVKENIFKDLVWFFPWYNTVEIENFTTNVRHGIQFKIYIQRDFVNEWIEVRPSEENNQLEYLYDYFIITDPNHQSYTYGSLYINYYGTDVSDTPNIKIAYQ